MKKNLLFAGLLLCAAPMFAQEGPERTAQDAKVMFEQDFEKDWDEFLNTEIDRITQMRYYVNNGSGTMNNTKIWQDTTGIWELGEVRDTLLILKNGVMTTDAAAEIEGFKPDQYTIVNDEGNNVERQAALDLYGVDGGTHYFRYTTDTVGIATNDYGAYHKDHTTANYRRNLFVRGLDIEEESSYRLTYYVKAINTSSTVKTTMYADVMRGYFHSEKPFSMGLEDDAKNNKYNKTFEYKKEAFTGDWEKVTFMTYYLNDSIADRFVFINGYWWDTDWSWGRPNGDTLRYVQQPDKFFVRLSFASDSTIFSVDNISLTKSWIAGVEYYKDLLRVDFGYQTNLKDLANAAYEKNKIAAVELPGEYFKVWGLDTESQEWLEVEINSAEYHGDGYMYMWTKPIEEGGMEYANEFEGYDSVLVTFINPVDREDLCLKYTGDMFPKALDIDWINDGKKVPNFYNEIGSMNPNIGKGVYSMKNLPPVLQDGITAEYGSFQLDGTLREFKFKISRKVDYDAPGSPAYGPSSKLALMHVSQAGKTEVWTVKEATDSTVTFERPASATAPLVGDYEFKLLQLKGKATDYGEEYVINYSFGKAEMPGDPDVLTFEGCETESAFAKGCNVEGFEGTNYATKVTDFSGLYSKALMFGLYGVNLGQGDTGAKCYLEYAFTAPQSGTMQMALGLTGCQKGSWNDDPNKDIYIVDSEGNELSKLSLGGTGFKPAEGGEVTEVSEVITSANVIKDATYKLVIKLPNENSWGGGHKGGLILYYIKTNFGLTLAGPYMSSFDAAQKKLAKQIAAAEANADNYTGEKYQAAVDTQAQYASFNVDKLETAPSVWNAATGALNNAANALAGRMSTVDNMWNAYNKSMEAAASYDEKSEADGVDYSAFPAYKALMGNCEKYENFIAKNETDDSIKAIQAIFENDVKALDAQKESYDKYVKALDAAKALVEAEDAQKGVDAYAALESAYNQYKDWDAVAASKDDVDAATAALAAATSEYSSVISAAQVNKIYYKALADLAKELNADLGGNEEEYAERAENTASDENLEKAYRTAIKAAIYKKVAAGEAVDSIPVSALIKNNELYASVKVVERMDKQMPANASDLSKADEGGANIQHTKHQYNDNGNMPIWIMIIKNDYTDLLQGWTARAEQAGNSMVTVSLNEAYNEFSSGQSFWNGELGMDWNSKASLAQTVEDLPVGLYSIGANFLKNTGSGTQFDITTGEQKTTAAVAANATGNNGADSIMIENGSADIKLTLTSGNGWSRVDDFYMVFRGAQEGFDYAAAAEAAQKEVNEIITFVPEVAEAAKVEYYGLDGVAIQAPKAGQIAVKVTKNAKGQRTIEKIRVK